MKPGGRRLLSPGWLAAHALMLVLVVTMLGLGAWQFSRATGGNALSWGYAAQWPAFAGFVGFVWAREVRRVLREADPTPARPREDEAVTGPARPREDEADTGPARPRKHEPARRPVITRRPDPGYDQPEDPELAAYNRYLAWLSANPGARPVDYPG